VGAHRPAGSQSPLQRLSGCPPLLEKIWHYAGMLTTRREDQPYAGGCFFIDIKIPSNYPFSPPKFKFSTEVWHPGVVARGSNGITREDGGTLPCWQLQNDQWSPALSIAKLLQDAYRCLEEVQSDHHYLEPCCAANGEAGKQFREDRAAFYAKARKWTDAYAA